MGLASVIVGVLRKFRRPIRNYNVENRAHKVISQDKPTRAPRYKVDQESLDRFLKENPNIVEELSKKNLELDNRLRDVFVSSVDVKPIEPIDSTYKKALPLNRKAVEERDYGCKEPETVTEGHATLKSIIKFINDHQSDKLDYTSSHIAAEYKLQKEEVDNILKYYSSFELFVPKKKVQPTQIPAWYKKLQESMKE